MSTNAKTGGGNGVMTDIQGDDPLLKPGKAEETQPSDAIGININIPTPIKNKKICIAFSRPLQTLTFSMASAAIIRDQLDDAIKLLEKV